MPRTAPLRRHAITAPVFGRGKLHRKRLVEILEANLDKRLILVVAPAGYGKTMLLADLTAHIDRPVCWVRLTEHDRDPARLRTILVESLGARFRRLKRRLGAHGLESLPPDKVGRWVGRGIAEAEVPPFVLMFDDVHLVGTSSESTAFLAGLIDALPRDVCCVLAGREALELPLAAAVGAGDVLAIGAGDLALAEDELEGLLKMDGEGEASAEVRERLMSESRGWIAGIQLLRLRGLEALQASVPDPRDLTFEYFGSEVLGKQSKAMQRFALESSVLPVMTAEAVEAVLGVEDGARWLRTAVRKGLFITVTGSSPKSYEYHPLFREHLWSAFVGRRAKRLRGYAADYLAAHGQEDVAVELYFKGGLPRKARLLIESASRGMRAQGRLDTLQKWDGLLESHGITSARLLLRLSYLLADQGRQPEARDAWRRATKSADVHSDEWVSFELRLQDGWLKLYGGDTKGSRGIALKCCRDLKYSRATPGFREEAFRLLALSHLFEGNVRDAAIYSRETVRISRRWAPFRRGQALLAHWAVMSYAGRTKETERARTAYLALPPNEMGPYHQLATYVGVATDAAYEGRFEEAIQIIGEGLAAARDLGSEVEEALLLLTLADLYSDSGRPASSLVVYERVAQLLNPSGEENWRTYVSFREAIALRRAGRDRTGVMEAQGRRSPRFRRAWRGEWDVEILMEEALQRPEYSLRRLGRMAAQESTAMRRILIGAHCAQILAETGRTGQAAVRLEECLHLADECRMPALLAGEISASSDLRSVGRGELAGNRLWAKLEEMLARGRRLPEFVLSSAGKTSARNPLVIEGLGRLRVMWSGDILEFKPKPLEVLLFIADRGSVPQDVLMEAFWGHLDPRRQAANLHSAMYSLRRKLGKRAIRVSSSVISFDAHFEVDFDVLTFLRESSMALSADRRRAGRLVVLLRATELYAGAFAPILDSEWARARRAGLQNVFSDLALALGETSLAEGVSSTAIPKLRLALEGEPYREDLATMLVRCLKAAGRKAEALHAASDFARLQMDDLGLHAGPDLAELIASLRRREESEEVTDAGYVVSAIANGT